MRLPYMTRDTQLTLVFSVIMSVVAGFGILGVVEDLMYIHTIEVSTFIIIIILSVFGAGFGTPFGLAGWLDFVDEFAYDRRHEKYRTVRTY